MVTLSHSKSPKARAQSQIIEVVGTVINPERERWGDVVLAEVDCNGENRKDNAVLFTLIPPENTSDTPQEGTPERDAFEQYETSNRIRKQSPYGTLTFKGPADDPIADPDSENILLSNRTYRFYGKVTTYTDKRTREVKHQFTFQTFVKIQPHGQVGIMRYLMDLPHIGRTTAAALWDKFQGQAVRILRESPEVAAVAVALPHFTEVKAKEAADKARVQQAMEACTIDLLDLLTGRGFPKSTAQSLVRRFGNRAARVVKNDPWKLRGLPGCGFIKTDKLAMDLGLDPDRLKRQALAALHVLESNKANTWMSVADVLAGMMELITGAVIKAGRALKCAKLAGLIVVKKDRNGVKWVAERRRASQEQHIARKVIEMLSPTWKRTWPDMSDGSHPLVSMHQLAGLTAATRKPIGIFRGGPGTGKSYSTCQFIKWLESTVGAGCIAVCAPTGKASGRLNNELSHYGCFTKARTAHSLLQLCKGKAGRLKDRNGELVKYDWETKFTFEHGPEKVLPFRYLFIDESFMLSTDMLCAILMAVGRHTQVVMIGDPQQLPPIDHGRPVLDLIAAGVPCGELTEPQRNAGTIVYACKDIAAGRDFRYDTPQTFQPDAIPPRNLEMVECSTPMMLQVAIMQRIERAKQSGLDPIWDVQLIIAVNNNSPLCRKKLNVMLQAKLNPTGKAIQGNPFREGDKVACTENGSYRCEDKHAEYADGNGEVRCDNGDIGRVVHIEANATTVEFSGPTRRVVFTHFLTRGVDKQAADRMGESGDTSDTQDEKEVSDTGCPLVLNYAGTCHGMQGSEAKYVIVVIDEYHGAKRICSCEWFVTGISRGKWATSIVGKVETAQSMCRNKAVEKRKTFLGEILIEELWKDL